jgi:nickel transport system ATP-binding protein
LLLHIEDLFIALKKTGEPLLQNVSFSLQKGCSLVVLGQSGSGKTLTCKTVTGILDRRCFEPSGKIVYEGQDLLSIPQKRLRYIYGVQIALIPQNPMTALNPSMRIGCQMAETLRLHTSLAGKEAYARVGAALQEAGLNRAGEIMKSYPYTLSGGMLQRVLIAMALMVDAKLIVADEPTTALDVENRNATVDTMYRLREKGTAILLVTHDFAVASRMGGDLLVMKDGQMVEKGNIREVLAAPTQAYTRALIRASRLSGMDAERGECAC